MSSTLLKLTVDGTGSSLTNDGIPMRNILPSGGIEVWKSGQDVVVSSKTVSSGHAGVTVTTDTTSYIIKMTQQDAITSQDTTITYTAPFTPDYAIQDLTLLTPYGFKTKDEGNTVLKVIANLQARVQELENTLIAAGIL